MKIIDVKLDTVCGYTSTLPVFDEPEIAFAGPGQSISIMWWRRCRR